jgi:hypothetical protein
VRQGVRYEPESPSASRAGGDRTAHLVAIDVASGEWLWRLPMWTVVDDPAAPPHPGRYFGSIGPGPLGHELLVRDEYGASFSVDLATQAVHALPPARQREAKPPLRPWPRPDGIDT